MPSDPDDLTRVGTPRTPPKYHFFSSLLSFCSFHFEEMLFCFVFLWHLFSRVLLVIFLFQLLDFVAFYCCCRKNKKERKKEEKSFWGLFTRLLFRNRLVRKPERLTELMHTWWWWWYNYIGESSGHYRYMLSLYTVILDTSVSSENIHSNKPHNNFFFDPHHIHRNGRTLARSFLRPLDYIHLFFFPILFFCIDEGWKGAMASPAHMGAAARRPTCRQ